jgi:nucleoside-diphosphate kinase
MQQTLSIIKPDAIKRNIIGKIFTCIENSGLVIKNIKKVQLTRAQAEEFYAVHKDRSFFEELVQSMIASPVVFSVLEGADAIVTYRKVMGATNPVDAADGTIRKLYAISIGENSVHGSDSEENAAIEIGFFNKI